METLLQQSWKRLFPPAQSYRFAAKMEGHHGPINCFALIGESELLASGGDDEMVKIWDLNSYKLRETLFDRAGRWGQVTRVQWIRLDNNVPGSGLLCIGTGRGRVAIFKRQRKRDRFVEGSDVQVFNSGDSIEAMSFDPVNFRVIFTSHHGKIKMFRLGGEEISHLWTVDLDEAIPRSVCFINRGEDILVYALESGEITCRDAQTAALKSSRTLKTAIGNVDVDEFEKNIVVDNMRSGFDVYPIHRSTPLHTFEISSQSNFVRMAVFGEKGTVVVGGSDHGRVYIFDMKSSQQPAQWLIHGKSTTLVQAILAASWESRHIIITGSSDDIPSICVWEKPTQRALLQKKRTDERRGETSLVIILLFLNFILAVTSPGWFPASQKELCGIFARIKSVAEKTLSGPSKALKSEDAFVIPHDVLMRLPHDVLMQLEGRTAHGTHISPVLREVVSQDSEEVASESASKPDLG